MDIKIYKIENSEGKFSTGTMYPRWTKKGKIWQSFSAVKLHLRQFCGTKYNLKGGEYSYFWHNNIPDDWIVLEITNNDVKKYSAKSLYPLTDN